MPWSDDLSQLLQPEENPPPFRQGYMLYFDPNTGNNIVDVGGGQLTDLPLLNIGDTVNIVGENTAGVGNGSVVIIMKMGASWAIMGRVMIPGSSALNSSAVSFAGANPFESNFTITTTPTIRAQGIINVPAWANRAQATCLVYAFAVNGSAGAGSLRAQASINGSGGSSNLSDQCAATGFTWVAAHATRNGFVVTPGGTITVEANISSSNANWGLSGSNFVQVDSSVIFSKA